MSTKEEPIEVVTTPTKPKKWVQFEDEEGSRSEEKEDVDNEPESSSSPTRVSISPEPLQVNKNRSPDANYGGAAAVLRTESVHVNLNQRPSSEHASSPTPSSVVNMRTIDLNQTANGVNATSNPSNAILRQGFANGDIIVTLLPVNTKFPWVTPAKFRPELVPEELMAQGLTLTVEDYVQIMALLTNDFRFVVYNVCYKRVLVVWIFTAFFILIMILFSGIQGLTLFGLGVLWLVINASAIFLCVWIKIKLNHNVEKCLAQVNKHLLRHKIILGLDDRGKMSCHKVNLCFIYFDTTECIKKLQDVIEKEEAEGRQVSQQDPQDGRKAKQLKERMDIDDDDIIIQGTTTSYVSRKQARGEQLLLRYIQRWCKDYLRRRLDWTVDEDGGNPVDPQHLSSALCPCQYIEEHLRNKPRRDKRAFCPCFTDFLRERGID